MVSAAVKEEGVGICAEREGSISETWGAEEMAAWGSTGLVEVSVMGRGLVEEGERGLDRGLGFQEEVVAAVR